MICVVEELSLSGNICHTQQQPDIVWESLKYYEARDLGFLYDRLRDHLDYMKS